jgi:hypothetical protein
MLPRGDVLCDTSSDECDMGPTSLSDLIAGKVSVKGGMSADGLSERAKRLLELTPPLLPFMPLVPWSGLILDPGASWEKMLEPDMVMEDFDSRGLRKCVSSEGLEVSERLGASGGRGVNARSVTPMAAMTVIMTRREAVERWIADATRTIVLPSTALMLKMRKKRPVRYPLAPLSSAILVSQMP